MTELFSQIDVYELGEVAAKIALSAILGGIVGAEREWSGKWAGLRTHMLIAVGAALITDVSVEIGARYAQGSSAWDPGRIAAQVVSGVGFIGAGTIIQARGTVRGLTTAAGLWVAAAIGMAVGARFYAEALVGTAALVITLAALDPLEKKYLQRRRRRVIFHLTEDQSLSALLDLLESSRIERREVKVRRSEDGRLDVEVEAAGPHHVERQLLELAADKGFSAESAG